MPACSSPFRLPAFALTLSCLLAACGGGGDDTADVITDKARRAGAASSSGQQSAPLPVVSSAAITTNTRSLQLLVPAYFYPLPGSAWDRLALTAKAMPSVGITAIVNPSNGPGKKADAQYARAIAAFRQAGGKVLGYVSTRYGKGTPSQTTVRTHIDRYLAFYGRENFSGFFIDEMADSSTRLGFYREVYDYIKGLDSNLLVVGNPGTLPIADYAKVADTLVTFEGQASAYASFNPQPGYNWVYDYDNGKQAMLVHDATSCPAMQASLSTAASARSHTGWVYVTDLHYDYANNIGDPWATLPAYWDKMLASVDAVNKGLALPGC